MVYIRKSIIFKTFSIVLLKPALKTSFVE